MLYIVKITKSKITLTEYVDLILNEFEYNL